jgi:hypothetical protein
MNITLRILIFGTVSGLLWAVVPGSLSDLFNDHLAGETATVFISGALSGLVVSFVLWRLLVKSSVGGALAVGILSLPLGAFAFGVIISFVQWVAREFTGVPYRFVADGFSPFQAGFQYAAYSLVTVFALILVPLSIVTTIILRAVIRSGRNHDSVA